MPWGTTYDFVSRGGSESECHGEYDSSTGKGWGKAYQYNCVRSGDIRISDDGKLATVWYNYMLASAGTIFSENTTPTNPANNITKATESVCPKGWTLPTLEQIQTIGNNSSTYASIFSPALGGYYYNDTLSNENIRGYWWGSEPYVNNGARRYSLKYSGGNLYSGNDERRLGFSVRCVQKSASTS